MPDQAAAGEQPRAGEMPVAPGIVSGVALGRGVGVDDGQLDGDLNKYAAAGAAFLTRWAALGWCPLAVRWLVWQQDLGRSPRTIEAYARSIVDYLRFCERPGRRGANVIALASGAGLANATLQLRVTVVRWFYDFLVEERVS